MHFTLFVLIGRPPGKSALSQRIALLILMNSEPTESRYRAEAWSAILYIFSVFVATILLIFLLGSSVDNLPAGRVRSNVTIFSFLGLSVTVFISFIVFAARIKWQKMSEVTHVLMIAFTVLVLYTGWLFIALMIMASSLLPTGFL